MDRPPKKPPPTDPQISEVRMWATELHYAFFAKPALDSPHRATWETHFRSTVASIVDSLNSARFRSLPRVALGCIWENNCAFTRKDDHIDIDAVEPVQGKHPILTTQEGKKLKIAVSDDGPMGLLPEEDLRDKWWVFEQPDRPVPRREGGRAVSDSARSSEVEDVHGEGGQEGAGPRGRTGSHASAQKTTQREPRRSQRPKSRVSEGPVAAEEVAEGDVNAAHLPRRTRSQSRGAPRTIAPPDAAPALSASTRAGLDRKGKRKAAPEGSLSGPDGDSKRVRSELVFEEEDVPWEWRAHPTPCQRCEMAGTVCLFCPLVTSSCQACHKSKVKCSLTISAPKSLIASYLAWVFWRTTTQPADYGPAPFPLSNAPVTSTTIPDWYAHRYAQFTASQRSLGPPLHAQLPEIPRASRASGPSSSVGRASRTRAARAHRDSSKAAPPSKPSSPPLSAISTRTSTAQTPSTSDVSLPPPSPSPEASETTSIVEGGFGAHADALNNDFAFELETLLKQGSSESDNLHDVPQSDAGDEESSGGWGGTSEYSRAADSEDGGSDGEGEGLRELQSLGADVDTESMAGSPPKGAHYARQRTTFGEGVCGVVHVTKVPPELERHTTSRAALTASTRGGDVAQVIVGFDEVPPLNGLWTDLPWLTSNGGDSSLWSPTLPLPLQEPSGRSANPISPPGTPPQRIFKIGLNTLAAIDDAREHVQDVAPIASENVRRVTTLRQVADRARVRRTNAYNAAPHTTSIHQALEGLYSQLQQSEGDLGQVASLLAAVAGDQGTLASTFRYVPTVPVGTATLVEMVEMVGRLEALYNEMWARYNSVREDIRPLRQSVSVLQHGMDELGNRLDGVPFEAAGALQPDVARAQARLLVEVSEMQRALLGTLGDIREALGRSPEIGPTVATALANAIQSTTASLNTCLQNVGRFISESERSSATVSQHVWDMETRLRRLEAIAAPDQAAGDVEATRNVDASGSVEAVSSKHPVLGSASHEDALQRLRERVDVLENTFETRVQAAVERGIKAYLEGYGLGDQALRRLADPITQSRIGWGIGSRSSERGSPEGAPMFPSVGFSFGSGRSSGS